MELPTIPASRVTGMASHFARRLAAELEDVNRKYPIAKGLEQENYETIAQAYADANPANAVPVFERLFLSYMASRYVIVPD
jgi:hypothetical protein